MKNRDKDSLENAYRLVESGDINTLQIGTSKGLQETHRCLFDSLYDDLGKLRKALFQKVESVLQTPCIWKKEAE